ncbi:MAG: type I restriction enzyme HsdR N-terminal domain-containing protein [Deltaproteobacteria bacterium]|nr:type I restriction enzyme HsdR N-terminal domain-containing protein [Deltaproteobacteria bacterium]
MLRLATYAHRVYLATPTDRRLMDHARGQLVPAGPEEQVRQDVVRSLIEHYDYPRDALFTEEMVVTASARRRADVLVDLPARPAHAVTLLPADQTTEVDRPYSLLREEARGATAVPFARFPAIPDAFRWHVDGRAIEIRTLGCGVCGLNVAVYGKVLTPIEGLPSWIAIDLLGYGRRPNEVSLARQWGLENVEATNPATDAFVEFAGVLTTPRCDMDGGIAREPRAGFAVAYPGDAPYGVLCELHAPSGADSDFEIVRAALEWLPVYQTEDGLWAYRDSLNELRPGDEVVVVDEGPSLVGRVVRADQATVTVLIEGRELVARRDLSLGEPFLAGRSAPLDPRAAVTRSGPRQRRNRTFIVVECKRPGLSCSEEIKQQGLAYARELDAHYLVLTTGGPGRGAACWTETYALAKDSVRRVDDIPKYEQAVSVEAFAVAAVPDEVPHLQLPRNAGPDVVQAHARTRRCIGTDTPFDLWLALLQLDDVLLASTPYFSKPVDAFGVTFAEDRGPTYHDPGNASGGRFGGRFRDFLVRFTSGEEVIFGLAVQSTAKSVQHAKWGNRRGRTTLTACLAVGGTYQPILQAALDECIEVAPSAVRLWHSGAATAGQGALPIARVLDFVREREPRLIQSNRVQLGTLPATSTPSFAEIADVLGRLARYTELRRDLKEAVRGERRARRK